MSLERNISSNNQKNSRKITLKVNSKAKKLAKPHSFYSEKLYYENVQDTKKLSKKETETDHNQREGTKNARDTNVTIKEGKLKMRKILT